MVLIACAIYAAVVFGVAFLLTLLFGRIALPILRAKKAGQPINEYVHAHQSKAGTPTMGGIAFVPAFLATMLGLALFTVTLGAKKVGYLSNRGSLTRSVNSDNENYRRLGFKL